jgi:hypothetical protein
LIVLTSVVSASGQYYTIPDTIFRNYLYLQDSRLFNENKQLILSNARAYEGAISCQNLNITDLSGLQFFHKVTMINCSGNQVTAFPSLDSLSSLSYLYAESCELMKLPSLDHLGNLLVLDVKDNNLTELPSLEFLKMLNYLDCSVNNLTELPALNSLTNLRKLFCYNNQLVKLPEINSLVNLQTLDCPGNRLKSLPVLSFNTELTVLRCGDNLIESLPDLNNLVNLKELAVERNRIVKLPDLSLNKQLRIINLASNSLTSIPDFSSYSNLLKAVFNNNKLSFSQLIPQTRHTAFKSVFEVNPQDTLLNYPVVVINRNDRGIIKAGVDENIETNIYRWYKDDTELNNRDAYVVLEPPLPNDSGLYLTVIRNTHPDLSDIILVVKSARVQIGYCLPNTSEIDYSIDNNFCNEGASIRIDDTQLKSSYKPFVFNARSTGRNSEVAVTGNTFQNILPGKYDLIITDQNNCKTVLNNFLDVPVSADCDNIITPNADGVDDTYYLPQSGKMKVLSKEGKIIKEIPIPGEWDGTDNAGNIVPIGLYILLINEKDKIEIIVLN